MATITWSDSRTSFCPGGPGFAPVIRLNFFAIFLSTGCRVFVSATSRQSTPKHTSTTALLIRTVFRPEAPCGMRTMMPKPKSPRLISAGFQG